jgi:hypothetical protein
MPNVKGQISNEVQIPNLEFQFAWHLSFIWHLDFEI